MTGHTPTPSIFSVPACATLVSSAAWNSRKRTKTAFTSLSVKSTRSSDEVWNA
jgi:hypothetical protein